MLAISTKPLAIWFGVSGDNESGSDLDRMFLLALGVAAAGIVARRRLNWTRALFRQRLLLALLAYMLISTVWSDITLIALKRWCREAMVIVMALAVIAEAAPGLALESLLRRTAYILVPTSLMLIKYYPALGVEYARWSGKQMWIGVTVHKNSLGRLCVLVSFFLLWALLRRWRTGERGPRFRTLADSAILVLTLFLLRGEENAYSATSIATLILGISTLLAFHCFRKLRMSIPRPVLLAVAVLLIAFGVSAPFWGGANVAVVSATLRRDETLTGRTETWAELVPVVARRPGLGCGFGSFWTTARREFYDMSHAHNGYLDILLELGWAGLMFYIAWLLACAARFHRAIKTHYEWASFALGLLLMILLYNAAESQLNSLSDEMSAVLVMAFVFLSYECVRLACHEYRSSPAGI
jgi:O-antigen ligase